MEDIFFPRIMLGERGGRTLSAALMSLPDFQKLFCRRRSNVEIGIVIRIEIAGVLQVRLCSKRLEEKKLIEKQESGRGTSRCCVDCQF